MTKDERALYHQIHPAKLAVDAAAGVSAVLALSQGWFVSGVAVAVAVPAAASFAVLQRADLERLKHSRFGAYVRKFMTPAAQFQRIAGFGVLSAAAWVHSYLLGVFGAALIIHAWTQGLLIPRDLRKQISSRS